MLFLCSWSRKRTQQNWGQALLDSAQRGAFCFVKFLRLSASTWKMPLRVTFRVLPIGQNPIVERFLWGDTVENRTLGMVNAGGKAAASHTACRLLYIHLGIFSHPSWICVRVRMHYPLPLEKGSERLWHACNSISPYRRVSARFSAHGRVPGVAP